MTSDRQRAIQRELSALEAPTWAESALLACFEVLSHSDSDVVDALSLIDGWTEGSETIKVVYRPPWGPHLVVGLVRKRYSPTLVEFLYDGGLDLSAPEFGRHVALRDVAEPLGTYVRLLDYDNDGVGWWGDGHTIGG
jgi:hypothetical protein